MITSLGQWAAKAIRAIKPRIKRATHPINTKVRSRPTVFTAARTARKPKVAAYLRAKREGKLDPVSGRNTCTSSGEGRGRAMMGTIKAPKTHIPARLRIERSAARQPARAQERTKMQTMIRKTQGNSAVRRVPRPVFWTQVFLKPPWQSSVLTSWLGPAMGFDSRFFSPATPGCKCARSA